MASVDYKLKNRNNEKRKVCVFTSNVKPAKVLASEGFAADGVIADGDVITLANLPANSIVTNASVQVVTGPTDGTQTVALAVGGTSIMDATAVGTDSNANIGDTIVKKVEGTLTLTVGAADLTDGEFEVLIEYIEPDLVTGELTAI